MAVSQRLLPDARGCQLQVPCAAVDHPVCCLLVVELDASGVDWGALGALREDAAP